MRNDKVIFAFFKMKSAQFGPVIPDNHSLNNCGIHSCKKNKDNTMIPYMMPLNNGLLFAEKVTFL